MLKVTNRSKTTVIAANAKEAKNLFAKSIGLIGKRKAYAIILETRFGIHTFGLNFPIDCLVLNRKKEIVDRKENISPWGLYFWNPKYNFVIELPAGTIKKSKTEIGDEIDIS